MDSLPDGGAAGDTALYSRPHDRSGFSGNREPHSAIWFGGKGQKGREKLHKSYLERVESGIPLGMDAETAGRIDDAVKQAFGPQARLIVRGSAATGKKYNPEAGNYNNSKSFDEKSDYDFALVDKYLLEEISGDKDLKHLMRQDTDGRTYPIYPEQLEELAVGKSERIRKLLTLIKELPIKQKRSIMVYGDYEQVRKRGPHFAVGVRRTDK